MSTYEDDLNAVMKGVFENVAKQADREIRQQLAPPAVVQDPAPTVIQAPAVLMGTQLMAYINVQRAAAMAQRNAPMGDPIICISGEQARTIDTGGQAYSQRSANQDWQDGYLFGCWVTTASPKEALEDEPYRQPYQGLGGKLLSAAEQGTARPTRTLDAGKLGSMYGVNIISSNPATYLKAAGSRPMLTMPPQVWEDLQSAKPAPQVQEPPPLQLSPPRAPIDWEEDAA